MNAAAKRRGSPSLELTGEDVNDGERRRRRRLLVALAVTGAAATEIDGLRRAVASSSLGRIEPHVTLVAPINVREDAVLDAFALVRRQAAVEPIAAVLGPARTFAPRNPVVYLEVSGEVAALDRLRRQVSSPPLAPPQGRGERAFVPHVTIASGMDQAAINSAIDAFADYRIDVTLSVLCVYEQDAFVRRHPWRRVADVMLGSRATVGRGGRELTFVESTVAAPDAALLMRRCDDECTSDEPFCVSVLDADAVVALARGAVVGNRLEVRSFVVEPERRRQGIGGQLLSQLERSASARGLGALVIFGPDDEGDETLFTRRGYRRAGMFASGADRDLVVYERRLGALGDVSRVR